MEIIKFEQLTWRGFYCVKKYKEFIDLNLNKINCNVIYHKDKYNSYSKQFWHPKDLYIGNLKDISFAHNNATLNNLFNEIDSSDIIEISSSKYFKYLGLIQFNENWDICGQKNRDILEAYCYICQKRFFCPEINKPIIIGYHQMNAFDESIFL